MWSVGQKVIAPTEPELGLGTITALAGRVLDVLFPAAGVRRRYAATNAPLRRLRLKVGQTATPRDGAPFVVTEIVETPTLLRYRGAGTEILETELGDQLPAQSLEERLTSGPWSAPRVFDLRRIGWELLSRSLHPDVRGLQGARVTPLPHQLDIARRVAARDQPRVLLADEVGLGKTIEAGLIFSSLRALDRASRVLVLAPRPLKHQWLSELYRRFNELFSVVDLEGELHEDDLDFTATPKCLTSIEFLLSDLRWMDSALAEPWDLLIVDEAHHLKWSADDASPEWEAVRALSQRARGLLLLTATPRQQGLETQFGLLHLVDPQRFADYDTFCREADGLKATASLARRVLDGDRSPELAAQLRGRFHDDADLGTAIGEWQSSGESTHLIQALVDRHGTGRVLMRNRRARLAGFPQRRLHSVPVDTAAARTEWLVSFLRELAPREKVLLLCRDTATVKKIDAALRDKIDLKRALFHDGMDIVERDRQAAWFAEPSGAQLLVSSEIGGEGRNFQFTSKLVLFDLPAHPDLLEQRIGRLDRIGQKRDIDIYAPWVRGGAEEVLFRWYHEGLRSFERAWNGGAPLVEALRKELDAALARFDAATLGRLIAKTRVEADRLEVEQRESVDTLVDLNSFDPASGERLRGLIADADRDPLVRRYMEAVFDHYGVEAEDFDAAGTLKLSAHSLTFVENFPELPPGSEVLATYSREQALAREDLRLLNADHPMVRGALSMLLDRDEGAVSVGVRGESASRCRLEALYVLQAAAPAALEIERYLPVTVFEGDIDAQGAFRPRTDVSTGRDVEQIWRTIGDAFKHRLAERESTRLGERLERAARDVDARAHKLVTDAQAACTRHMDEELARLEQLAHVNATVRPQEIASYRARRDATLKALAAARPRLDALRIVAD